MAGVETTTISRPRPADFIPGYRLEKLVGRGGMGEVHQAVQLSLGRTVAVKLLAAELATDAQFVARFEKEGAALAALRHPNIVSIVDKGKTDTTYYLVMEFVDGPSLREVMRSPLLDAAQSLKMMDSICRAIDYAHQRGVIHRDLKPENILFDEQAGSIAKVTDFGLAGLDERFIGAARNVTQTHVAMGTAAYMAPEQKVDAKSVDHRADIYSLGVLLYEMLVGETPAGSFEPPSVKKPELDKRLDGIVAKCLRPAPADRYASVSELISALEPLLPSTSILHTAKPTRVELVVQKARSAARRVALVGAAAVVAVALAIVLAAVLRDRAASERQAAGLELTTDTGTKWPLTTQGRIDRVAKAVSLGEGPDTVSVVAHGRPATVEGGAVRYGLPEDGAKAGRAVIDVPLESDGLQVSVEAQLLPVPRSRLEPVKAIFRGPSPDARSALLLVGEAGRFVALVVSSAGAAPTLEWALGPDKRGAMTMPWPMKSGATHLALRIEPESGDLVALLGKDKDQRPLGEPLRLGRQWISLFGEPPRAAVGCLDGTCSFSQVQVEGLSLAPPPPPPPIEEPPEVSVTPATVKPNPGLPSPPPPRPVTVASVKRPPPKPPEPPKPVVKKPVVAQPKKK